MYSHSATVVWEKLVFCVRNDWDKQYFHLKLKNKKNWKMVKGSFLEIYLVYTSVCLKFVELIIQKLEDFCYMFICLDRSFVSNYKLSYFECFKLQWKSYFFWISRCLSPTDWAQKLPAPSCWHCPRKSAILEKHFSIHEWELGIKMFQISYHSSVHPIFTISNRLWVK